MPYICSIQNQITKLKLNIMGVVNPTLRALDANLREARRLAKVLNLSPQTNSNEMGEVVHCIEQAQAFLAEHERNEGMTNVN
jgi:hypothetical protein